MSIKSRFQSQLREASARTPAGGKPAWRWITAPYWETPSDKRWGYQVAGVTAQVEFTGAEWPPKELVRAAYEAFDQEAQKLVAKKDPKEKARYKRSMGGFVSEAPSSYTQMLFYKPEY